MNELFYRLNLQWEWVGSVAINGAGEDLDIAIRVPEEEKDQAVAFYTQGGWLHQGGGYQLIVQGNNFSSFKRGDYNILLCYDDIAYDRFVKGRDYCIFLKSIGVDMTSKAVRIAIHELSAGVPLAAARRSVARLNLLQDLGL